MADDDRSDVGAVGAPVELDQEKWRHLLASDDPYEVLEWHSLSLGMCGSVSGVSAATMDLRARQIPRASMSGQHVLVTGETGTGKELVVREIAANSERKGEFVPVNCAAIAADRFEADIFGWAKGGFTGADRDSPGLLKQADGGSLFLDELGEVPAHVQAKLLRVAEDQQFYRLGDSEAQHADVRLFAATNNPRALRDDILWRFPQRIHMPPLRDRLSDVLLMLQTLLEADLAQSSRRNPEGAGAHRGLQWAIDPHTLVRMVMSEWPGNVRELKNAVTTSLTAWAHTLQLDHGEALRHSLRIPFSYAPQRDLGEMLHDPLAISFIWSDWVRSLKGAHLRANGLAKKRLTMIDEFFRYLPMWAMECGLFETRYASEARSATDEVLPMFTWGEALRFLCAMFDCRAGSADDTFWSDVASPRQDLRHSMVLKLQLLDQYKRSVFRLPEGVADTYQQDGARKPEEPWPDLSGFSENELLRLYYAQLRQATGGVQKDMAERAGFSTQTVARRLRDLGLK